VTAVLLRMPRRDALDLNPQAQPPDAEFAPAFKRCPPNRIKCSIVTVDRESAAMKSARQACMVAKPRDGSVSVAVRIDSRDPQTYSQPSFKT